MTYKRMNEPHSTHEGNHRMDRASEQREFRLQQIKGGAVEDIEAYTTRTVRRNPPTIGAVSAGGGGATAGVRPGPKIRGSSNARPTPLSFFRNLPPPPVTNPTHLQPPPAGNSRGCGPPS